MRKIRPSPRAAKKSRRARPSAVLPDRFDAYLREHPLRLLGQAAAVGCVLRFFPWRLLMAAGLRLSGPIAVFRTLWKACDRLDQMTRPAAPRPARISRTSRTAAAAR